MLTIACPWCGPRAEDEFVHGGEAHVARPGPPDAVSAEDWANYLFYHDNPRGPVREQWRHQFGCRQWFHVVRDTETHEILAVYRVGDPPPPVVRP